MMVQSRILTGVLLTVMLVFSSPVVADSPDKPRYSLDDAVRIVRKQVGGEVLRAETRKKSGHTVYFIRVLTRDGRVRTVVVDARTGKPR